MTTAWKQLESRLNPAGPACQPLTVEKPPKEDTNELEIITAAQLVRRTLS
jgi:hypothetical protein